MSIKQIDVHGFRSLRQVSWRPGKLNVVIGENGSGKSNLLRMLELISFSAQGRLGKYVQSEGGIEPLLWDGEVSEIAFELGTFPLNGQAPKNDLTYEVKLGRLGSGSAYRVDYELLADYDLVEKGIKSSTLKHIERQKFTAKIFDDNQRSLVAPKEEVLEEETLLSQVAGPFASNKIIGPFKRQLESWSIYQDIHVDREAAIRKPAVARVESQVAPDAQNLITVLHTLYTGDRDFKQTINQAMQAAFGSDFDELTFPPAADQRIQMRVRWKSLRREQSTADLSDGTLRFLFLLAALASPSPAPVIAIDEPETGLHPSMLPIIAEHAVDASLRSQVIFTTHSDQFLDAFSDTKPVTTVARRIQGETVLRTLNEDSLKIWLSQYSLGALYRSGELESEAVA